MRSFITTLALLLVIIGLAVGATVQMAGLMLIVRAPPVIAGSR